MPLMTPRAPVRVYAVFVLALVLVFWASSLRWAGVARAGLVKNAGRDFGQGAAEALQPALAATIADVDRRLLRHEDRIGNIAGGLVGKANVVAEQRLDQVDRILEARLLQAKLELSEVTEGALGQVDDLARNRLEQAGVIGRGLVEQLGQEAQDALATADTVLRDRIADVGQAIDGAVEKADGALAARIAQVDELAGRRLGNLDVIASKQRIALERTAFRLAIVLGLVMFVVYVLKQLWTTYQSIVDREPDPAADPGANAGRTWQARGAWRAWLFVRKLGKPLLGYVSAAAAAGALLFLLHDQLPLGAHKEALELARSHELGLERSLERFEFTRVLFHASQLEHLTAPDGARYRALAAKAELLRDLFARPTLWGTSSGLSELSDKARTVRRLLDGAPDPDLLVVEAMLLWQTGGSRKDEHKAASLCARAFRLRPRGFALAPVARAHIESFLQSPLVDEAGGLGRDSETIADLREILQAAAPDDPDHPLATQLALARRMREVDAASSRAYVAMASQHRDLVRLQLAKAGSDQLAKARQERTRLAREVVQVWTDFDRWLASDPLLAGNPAVLGVFRLNDALYTRAKWFSDNPAEDRLAPLLASPSSRGPRGKNAHPSEAALSLASRLALAPPRLVWARRYRPLMNGPARTLLELQEAERFQTYETAARDLERALVAAAAPGSSQEAAAALAAGLGLYVDQAAPGSDRIPYARLLLPRPHPAAREDTIDKALQARGVRLL
jgi:hypothetical protein